MKKFQAILCFIIVLFSFSQANAQAASYKDAASNVLTAYFGVKNALITGNAATVNTKAKDLLAALTAFPADKLPADEKKIWTDNITELQFDAEHLSESKDIAHQREHFASMSENMYQVVKGLKFNTAAVYKDYCPMRKVYWLSETSAIKNPYYGNQMLTCGTVKETLNPAGK